LEGRARRVRCKTLDYAWRFGHENGTSTLLV